MRAQTFLITWVLTLFTFPAYLLWANQAKTEKPSGQKQYSFTGSYNPRHRNEKKPVAAEIKQREAFWAAFCNISVNLVRLEGERVFTEGKDAPGWSARGQAALVEVMAMSDNREGEQAVCRMGNLAAIFTREGELSAMITRNPRQLEGLRLQKWPAMVGGLRITAVRYSGNCEGSDCECEITVEYP